MDEEYDAIVCGTGLKECVISGLLSVSGKKVLHVDRNDYYGGESASLNLSHLFEKFESGEPPESWGHNRYWNVDLIPKFLMADGILVKMLIYTDVSRYLEFRSVNGSYVFKMDKKGGKINKVPATDGEVFKSSLLGFREKFRARKFFIYIQEYKQDVASTHQGFDCLKDPMSALFDKFNLEQDTRDFVGHALALWTNDDYLSRPAVETLTKIKLYADSLMKYSNSPYIYPKYGLGELPQAFARLCAINGGTYMLRQPVDEVVFDENGAACGIRSGDQTAKAKLVVGDPSYFPDKVQQCGLTARAICILNGPAPNTNNMDSFQIIVPGRQVGRKHDIYVSCLSAAHSVCLDGKYIGIVSTQLENTTAPDVDKELEPGYKLLGNIEKKFTSISKNYEPIDDGKESKIFISTSYDATSHFETTSLDILDIYKRIHGEELDLTLKPKSEEETPNQ